MQLNCLLNTAQRSRRRRAEKTNEDEFTHTTAKKKKKKATGAWHSPPNQTPEAYHLLLTANIDNIYVYTTDIYIIALNFDWLPTHYLSWSLSPKKHFNMPVCDDSQPNPAHSLHPSPITWSLDPFIPQSLRPSGSLYFRLSVSLYLCFPVSPSRRPFARITNSGTRFGAFSRFDFFWVKKKDKKIFFSLCYCYIIASTSLFIANMYLLHSPS